MTLTEEKVKYYFACNHLWVVIAMDYYLDSLESINVTIPAEHYSLSENIASWLMEEQFEIENQENISRSPRVREAQMDEILFNFRDKLLTVAHKLSDEMCWISEANFVYLGFCEFVRGTLEVFEQLVSDFNISPYYTDEEKPDFNAFIEFLKKNVPSDSAAKVKVEALGQELVQMWREGINKAAAEYTSSQE